MTTYTTNKAHAGAFIVYINGIEVPAKSVSLRYGIWQIPEMQLEMVADPVLTRLGAEDRVQVVVFYLDDTLFNPSMKPEFRLFGEGEITGWGYQNTSGGRSIVFTCVNQFAVFTQLFVHFLTQLDDMVGHGTFQGAGSNEVATPSSQIVFPFSLFQQGLIPAAPGTIAEGVKLIKDSLTMTDAEKAAALSQDPGSITRPFDFLYNCVKNMIGAQVPAAQRTIPATNFFTRWARLTNFHNRFAALPYFDEVTDKNIFPVLKAVQSTSAVDVIAKNLMPQVQNKGSIMDMLQLVYQTMYMEVAMIPSMPLVNVNLKTDLVLPTYFTGHMLKVGTEGDDKGKYIAPSAPAPMYPKRMQNYFAKPQFLFGIPPACNVIFPSQIKTFAYDEVYSTQPTRLYFNEEVLHRLFKNDAAALNESIMNALATAYPPEANAMTKAKQAGAHTNGKNFLLFPEEFFKGPVMDRRTVPPWLFFLKQHENKQEKAAAVATALVPAPTSSTPTASPAVSTSPQAAAALTKPQVTLDAAPIMPVRKDFGRYVNGSFKLYKSLEALRPLAEKYGAKHGVPPNFLLIWCNFESTGRVGAINENARGFFQIMGPKSPSQNVAGSEAGDLGLTFTQWHDQMITDREFGFEQGVRLAVILRAKGDKKLATFGITGWNDADRWRIAKMYHGLPTAVTACAARSVKILGRPPKNWGEYFAAGSQGANDTQMKVLEQAAAAGSVIDGATGITKNVHGQFSQGGLQISAPGGSPVAAPPAPAPAAPATPPEDPGVVSNDIPLELYQKLRDEGTSVYSLYAEYEFYRERYSRRSGSVVLAFNPYVVPGFPVAIFDSRTTRVDLFAYCTTVMQRLSNSGSGGGNSTQIAFTYARTVQEMFGLMAHDFRSPGAAVAGVGPREPVRDIRKVVQDFTEAELFYQRLFYGGQKVFGKDASFDWRKIIGYAPQLPTEPPEPIFIEGVSEMARDTLASAGETLAELQPQYNALTPQVMEVRRQMADADAIIGEIRDTMAFSSISAEDQKRLDEAQASLMQGLAKANQLEPLYESLANRINAAKAAASNPSAWDATLPIHNLTSDRELVPLAGAAALFDNYDEAMRYNWRPICTLDEYVIFHDSAGEGAVPAVGHPRSAGARYYDRIRRFTPLTPDTVIPPGATGLASADSVAAQPGPEGDPHAAAPAPTGESKPGKAVLPAGSDTSHRNTVPGITSGTGPHGTNAPGDFPQTREDWDKILDAYKHNVISIKTPMR